jgi:hypothetical protein
VADALVDDDDVIIDSNRNGTGRGTTRIRRGGIDHIAIDPATGDIVFTTAGVERGRITAAGGTSGVIGGAAVSSPFVSNFGPTSITIPATKFNVKADNSTDDTAAVQAALDAAQVNPYGASNINDYRSIIVQLPPGNIKLNGTIKMHANTILRGHGPFGTLLVTGGSADGIQLSTGNEVSCEVRDLGIVMGNGSDTTNVGINFQQTGQASGLGDSRHCFENLVILFGATALRFQSSTENRVTDCSFYYQTPASGHSAFDVFGTDCMVERLTVANVRGSNGSGIRWASSNSRAHNIKIFGNGGGTPQPALLVIGQRNQFHGIEVQDYSGTAALEDDQGKNVFDGVVIDSCNGSAMYFQGASTLRNVLVTNRGGAFTTAACLFTASASGLDIELNPDNIANVWNGSSRGAGDRIKLLGVTPTNPAYAATITPDPARHDVYTLATITGNLTIANPSPTNGNLPYDTRLRFVLPVDATGGYTLAFGTAYKLKGAVPPLPVNQTVAIDFFYDGTNWQETSRSRLGNLDGSQTVAFASSITPDPYAGGYVVVGTLTGAMTVNNPAAGALFSGMRLGFQFIQDGSGGHTVTWGTQYKGVTGSTVSTTANTTTTLWFIYDSSSGLQPMGGVVTHT